MELPVVQCVFFLGSLIVFTADALMCYQCAGTSLNSPCIHDIQGMTNASRNSNDSDKVEHDSKAHSLYAKNCGDSNRRWNKCVIESHEKNGNLMFFKRDCHDGKYFRKEVNDDEFISLIPNNATTCAYIEGSAVCFTFCQKDYCNGPQYNDTCDQRINGSAPPGCGVRGLHDNNHRMWVMQLLVLTIVCRFSWIALTDDSD